MLGVDADSDLGGGANVSDVILDAWHDCIGNYLRLRVLNYGSLYLGSGNPDSLTLLSRLTRTHV